MAYPYTNRYQSPGFEGEKINHTKNGRNYPAIIISMHRNFVKDG